MLELTGIASLLRGVSVLYWLLAAAALTLIAWKVKRWPYKVVGLAVVLILFGYSPFTAWQDQQKREAYRREAWAYFKKKCDTEAGEKIYKTVAGVRSVLIVKPLPPATENDLFDQFWYGDPYSNATPWNQRDLSKADTLLRDLDILGAKSVGLDYVEIQRSKAGEDTIEKLSPDPVNKSANQTVAVLKSGSRFALSWEDISKPDDRKYWIAGSRLSIVDLTDNSVVAERIGYLIEPGFGSTSGQRRPWLTARGVGPNSNSCPLTDTLSDRLFILKVLKPTKE